MILLIYNILIMSNNHIENLVNNIKTTVDSLVLTNSKIGTIKNNDDKFNKIEKIITLLQTEIIEIKTKLNDSNNNSNINNEINNLKEMINNVNEMSFITNNNNNYEDEFLTMRDIVTQNDVKYDLLNNQINIINDKLYNLDDVNDLSKDIKFIKSKLQV